MEKTNFDYDVIVIGGGSLGLATSYQLGKKQAKTLVLERFTFLNEKGSSAGVSRQYRVPYPDAYMVQMAADAMKDWTALELESGKSLMDKVGTLWFGDPNVQSTEGNIKAAKAAMDSLGIYYDDITKAQLEDQYGFRNLPDNYEGLFQADGASINLQLTLEVLLDLNQKMPNVALKENSLVTGIEQFEDGSFSVSVGTESFTAAKIVVVPGPYVNEMLDLLGFQVPLTYWQMTSCYFKKQNADIQYPTWFAFQPPVGDSGNEFYGFPAVEWDNPDYIRVAPDFVMRPLTNPNEADFIPNQQELDYTSQWVQNNMTDLDSTPELTSTCLIALSNVPNKELLLDFAPCYLPNNKNIVICATGWAAKFIPLVGRILADMAIDGNPRYDISNFKIDVFQVNGSNSATEYDKNIPLDTGFLEDLKIDTAIVGAGMSGLYSAYRLTETNKMAGDQVQIFDLGNRICGRIESIKLPEMNVVGELGGMRYLHSQKIITTLIECVFRKNLTPIDFPMGDSQYLYAYLRKQRMKQDAWEVAQGEGKKLKTNYQLNENTVGFNADQLFNKIFYDVLMADKWFRTYNVKSGKPKVFKGATEYDYTFQLTSRDWDEVKLNLTYFFPNSPYHNRKVYELGFWNLIKDQVSQEGYNFLADAGGYYSNTINWNAAEAFPYMIGDFSADTTYKTIATGFDSIGYELAKEYLKHDGAKIWTENKLVTFSKKHDFSDTHKYQLTFLNLKSNKKWHVYANKIILAMPRRSLELLDQNNFFFNINKHKELNHNIRSVIMEPAYKILMGFENAWWKPLGIDSGHSITDLPMRQCYYFGTDEQNGHSMLLGSYGDMSTETFWKALSDDSRLFQPRLNRMAMSNEELQFLESIQASELMVKEVVAQLKEVHGMDIPEPYVTWFRDWTDDPFGAGYHAWKAGYQVNKVMPYMRKPLHKEDIHICGEAYSDLQGWIEGAFCEAEKMLEEHFDLEYPSWLEKGYYLGW